MLARLHRFEVLLEQLVKRTLVPKRGCHCHTHVHKARSAAFRHPLQYGAGNRRVLPSSHWALRVNSRHITSTKGIERDSRKAKAKAKTKAEAAAAADFTDFSDDEDSEDDASEPIRPAPIPKLLPDLPKMSKILQMFELRADKQMSQHFIVDSHISGMGAGRWCVAAF